MTKQLGLTRGRFRWFSQPSNTSIRAHPRVMDQLDRIFAEQAARSAPPSIRRPSKYYEEEQEDDDDAEEKPDVTGARETASAGRHPKVFADVYVNPLPSFPVASCSVLRYRSTDILPSLPSSRSDPPRAHRTSQLRTRSSRITTRETTSAACCCPSPTATTAASRCGR